MAQTNAWLLSLGDGLQTAIGYHQIIEYIAIDKVEIKTLPLTYDYAPGVLIKDDQVIPVLDLAAFFAPKKTIKSEVTGLVLMQFQDAPSEPLKTAGLLVRSAPKEILVSSDMASALPQSGGVWKFLAEACFNYEGAVTPVLLLENAFGAKLGLVYNDRLKKLKAAQLNKKAQSKPSSSKAVESVLSKPMDQ